MAGLIRRLCSARGHAVGLAEHQAGDRVVVVGGEGGVERLGDHHRGDPGKDTVRLLGVERVLNGPVDRRSIAALARQVAAREKSQHAKRGYAGLAGLQGRERAVPTSAESPARRGPCPSRFRSVVHSSGGRVARASMSGAAGAEAVAGPPAGHGAVATMCPSRARTKLVAGRVMRAGGGPLDMNDHPLTGPDGHWVNAGSPRSRSPHFPDLERVTETVRSSGGMPDLPNGLMVTARTTGE